MKCVDRGSNGDNLVSNVRGTHLWEINVDSCAVSKNVGRNLLEGARHSRSLPSQI